MAKDRPPKKPGSDSTSSAGGDSLSPLERYLAKQKAEKPTRSDREIAKASVKESALEAAKAAGRSLFNSGSKSGSSSGGEKATTPPEIKKPVVSRTPPSLHGIERPPLTEKPQPASLSRWESFGDKKSDDDKKPNAREIDELAASVPMPPPSAANRGSSRFNPAGSSEPSGISGTSGAQPAAEDQEFPITHGEPSTDHLRPGEFGVRFVAYMIDVLILGCASIPVRSVAATIASIFFGSSAATHALTSDTVVYLIMVYAYFGYFYSTRGASPGKLMLNLRVTELDGVTKLTPMKAFFREALGKWISGVPFAMGYIIVLLRSDRRALHDLLFDTRVTVNNDRRP